MRNQCATPLSPETKAKQDHEITRLALLMDEVLKYKYVIGSDEFGMHFLPPGQYRWVETGSNEVKSVVKEEVLSTD
jgi:hypothetical protein